MFKVVQISAGHDNYFTPLRLIFAYMVLVGHAFVVIGGTSDSEPHVFFHFTFSYLAVNLFFIASGFLVTGSILYSKNVKSFTISRFLRIYPGLIVHVLLLMLIFGPLTTNIPLTEYFANGDTLKQPFVVLPFIETDMTLPGILASNHEQEASAALWTLRYEALAYIGTLIAFVLGLLKHRWMLLAQFLVFAIAFPLTQKLGIYDTLPATLQSLLRFGLCYCLGAAIYGYRDVLKFHVALIPVFFIIAALVNDYVIFESVFTLALGYALFWIAYVKVPALKSLQDMGDVSYGLYIYHWAVLQGVYYFMPHLNVWQLIAISGPIAAIIAALSWKFVEKPALKLKSRFSKAKKPIPTKATSSVTL
ncbi:MAG: hypothetical protein COA43_01260 [Robiginitomaculum sp.]|nr:MAG: hypothetical protein COA43_01260 [Robiginitomaculum sp.]